MTPLICFFHITIFSSFGEVFLFVCAYVLIWLTWQSYVLCHSPTCWTVCMYVFIHYDLCTMHILTCFLSLYIHIVLDPMEFCHNTSEGIGRVCYTYSRREHCYQPCERKKRWKNAPLVAYGETLVVVFGYHHRGSAPHILYNSVQMFVEACMVGEKELLCCIRFSAWRRYGPPLNLQRCRPMFLGKALKNTLQY